MAAGLVALSAALVTMSEPSLQAGLWLFLVVSVAAGGWYAGAAGPSDALAAAQLTLKAEIEDRRRLEGELRQARKLEAIGHLAGGVAHDFNNILMVIQGYADMLVADAPDTGTARNDLREIQDAARRGSDLTRQLLTFCRKQAFTTRPVDLNAVLSDTGQMLARLIGESVRLELRTSPVSCAVEADRVQLEQVLINLAVNARDAMSGRGTLQVQLDRVTTETDTRDVPCGHYVRLTVRDTGCGMDEATRERIFEPFFTTKQADEGSGLGLSTVYGVVKQLGGHISVESAPRQGTTFTIHFPATTKPLAARRDTGAAPAAARKAATVLLVEDDRAVRTVVESVLRRHGYAVVQAATPNEALAAARAHAGAIDLVLTDVVMPEMSGPEMVTLLAKQHPETCAVYLSGYSGDALMRQGVLESRPRLLQKPVATGDLLHAVRGALGNGSSRHAARLVS